MNAATVTTNPPATATASLAANQNLPAVVAQALTAKTANDPNLLSLVGRILAGTATLSDNFRYLLLVNQVTLEEFHKSQRLQANMQRGRRPRTRCRRN